MNSQPDTLIKGDGFMVDRSISEAIGNLENVYSDLFVYLSDNEDFKNELIEKTETFILNELLKQFDKDGSFQVKNKKEFTFSKKAIDLLNSNKTDLNLLMKNADEFKEILNLNFVFSASFSK